MAKIWVCEVLNSSLNHEYKASPGIQFLILMSNEVQKVPTTSMFLSALFGNHSLMFAQCFQVVFKAVIGTFCSKEILGAK